MATYRVKGMHQVAQPVILLHQHQRIVFTAAPPVKGQGARHPGGMPPVNGLSRGSVAFNEVAPVWGCTQDPARIGGVTSCRRVL
jgi:hypothetical protein